MAWEPNKQVRKLLIEDHGMKDGRKRYRLSPFMRVERGNGDVYLEPFPAFVAPARLSGLYDFSDIEIVPPPSTSRGDSGGSLGQTCMGPQVGVLSSYENKS